MEPWGDWLSGPEACVVSTLGDLCVISLGTKTTARWRRKIAYAKCCCIAVIGCTLYTRSHSYSHTASQEHIMFNHCIHHAHKCCLVSREIHEFSLSSEDSCRIHAVTTHEHIAFFICINLVSAVWQKCQHTRTTFWTVCKKLHSLL